MSVAAEPSGGFTAVNGKTLSPWPAERPPSSSSPTSAMENNMFTNSKPESTTSLLRDEEATRKRKRIDDDDGSPKSDSSQRPRLSPPPRPQPQPETLPPITSGQSSSAPFVTQEPNAQASKPTYINPGENHWQSSRSSGDENTTETRLVEVLGPRDNSAQGQTNGVHSVPTVNGHTQPDYPSPSSEHQQSLLPQASLNGPLPTLQGVTAPGLQKQRKRNFANRTKTGCLTCRERKKKCDEGKPECNNCKRGGFECKGYSQTNPLRPGGAVHQNISMKLSGAFDGSNTQAYTTTPFGSTPGFYHHDPQLIDHNRAQAFARDDPIRSMHDPSLTPSYSRNFSDSHISPFVTDGIRPEYPHPPLMSDYGRDSKVKLPPPGSMGPPHGAPPRSSPYSQSQNVAQLALNVSQPNGLASAHLPHQTEKEKMINHSAFDPNDFNLKEERLQCAKRLARFNKASEDPGAPSAPSEHQIKELFRDICECRDPDTRSPKPLQGYLGENINVQAPFYCDYGYNVKIYDNVDIGRNCTIGDACTVKIGKNCIIGPNVTFLSQDGDHHPQVPLRPGQKRLSIGKQICVDDDVFIGGNSVICMGVHIGTGATIPAGTVVDRETQIKPGTMVQRTDAGIRFAYGGWGPPAPQPPPR